MKINDYPDTNSKSKTKLVHNAVWGKKLEGLQEAARLWTWDQLRFLRMIQYYNNDCMPWQMYRSPQAKEERYLSWLWLSGVQHFEYCTIIHGVKWVGYLLSSSWRRSVRLFGIYTDSAGRIWEVPSWPFPSIPTGHQPPTVTLRKCSNATAIQSNSMMVSVCV